ncbi:MAG: AtpZ/AtpI family protein [Edaphocola sp.]
MNTNERQKDKSSNWLRYSGLGMQMLALMGLGVWGGLKLDARWHCSPLMLVVLSVSGLGISLYQVYKQLVK